MESKQAMGRANKANLTDDATWIGVTHKLGDRQAGDAGLECRLGGLEQPGASHLGVDPEQLLFAIVLALKVSECEVVAQREPERCEFLGEWRQRLALRIESNAHRQQPLATRLCEALLEHLREQHPQAPGLAKPRTVQSAARSPALMSCWCMPCEKASPSARRALGGSSSVKSSTSNGRVFAWSS